MNPVRFDDVPRILVKLADDLGSELEAFEPVIALRDLWGRVRFVVPRRPDPRTAPALVLEKLARAASKRFGRRAYPPAEAILYADETLAEAKDLASEPGQPIGSQRPVFHLIDRQVTGQSWATVLDASANRIAHRVALYSLKGGVGRSTATAAAAWHLARQGRSVMVLDLDLESPGLSTSLLPPASQPEFGIVDWFVEDAVDQGQDLVRRMSARGPIARDLPGEIWIVPSHGADPGDFVAKLGRCYLDLPRDGGPGPWERRLARLLEALEEDKKPQVVLLDTRSGLHDLASTAVTELADTVLLFAVGSEQTWNGYRLLFEYWHRLGQAEKIRERLQMVAALIPETDRESYLSGFREKAWELLSSYLYDELGAGEIEGFSFDLNDDPAPHTPLPIYWNRGLSALSSLVSIDPQLVDAAAGTFLRGFDNLLPDMQERTR